jgi:hypothetical protein
MVWLSICDLNGGATAKPSRKANRYPSECLPFAGVLKQLDYVYLHPKHDLRSLQYPQAKQQASLGRPC